jgi:hypothetical protein
MEKKKKKKLGLTEWLFELGHDYSLMHSAGITGSSFIAFDHVTCKYYSAPEKEIVGKDLDYYMNYLRWEFDQFEEVTKEIEKEVKAKTKAGNETIKKVKEKVIVGIENKFPPTPENIKKKKDELISAAVSEANGSQIDIKAIQAKVTPRLSDHEKIVKATERSRMSDLDRLAQDLGRQIG